MRSTAHSPTNPSGQAPRIFIPYPVMRKLMTYVRRCSIEINGFGYVDQLPDGSLFVSDVFILEQTATAGSVTTDPQALNRFAAELINRGENPARVCLQWHSHVKMDAYFSLTDERSIESWPGDLLISLVTNHYGDYSCRLDTYTDLQGFRRIRSTVSDISLVVMDDQPSDELVNMVDADIKAMVHHRGSWRIGKRAIEPPQDLTALELPVFSHPDIGQLDSKALPTEGATHLP